MHGTSISIIPEQRILILPHRPHTGTSHALDAGKKARKLASRAGRSLQDAQTEHDARKTARKLASRARHTEASTHSGHDAGKKARKLASRAGRNLQGEAYREKPRSGEIGGAVGRPGRHVRPEQQTGTTDRNTRQEHQAGTPDRNTRQEHQAGPSGHSLRKETLE